MALSELVKRDGIYDPAKRGAFTNWSDEDYVGMWDGKKYTIKQGDTVTLPEHLAIHFTVDFVDREMRKDEKAKFKPTEREPSYEQSERTMVGISSARRPYEEKTLKWLEATEETTEMQILRQSVREQVVKDLTAQVETAAPKAPTMKSQINIAVDPKGAEFAGVTTLK